MKFYSNLFDNNYETGNFINYLDTLDFVTEKNIAYMESFYQENLKNIENYQTVLLKGEVQSGKTNNIIYLINKNIENREANCFIYLTGNLNAINEQNISRLEKAFKAMNKAIVFRNLQGGHYNYDQISQTIAKKDAVIFTGIKNPEYFRKLINNLKYINEYSEIIRKIIIIDDESDIYSLSQRALENINDFLEIKNTKIQYIQITATPYRNLYYNQNFFEHYRSLPSPPNYKGIDYFEDNMKAEDEDKIIWETIKSGICCIIKNQLNKGQILFFGSRFSDRHDLIRNEILEIIAEKIKYLKEQIKYSNGKKNKINFMQDFGIKIPIDDYLEILEILQRNVFVWNHKENFDLNYQYAIVIGGVKLSRGMTFDDIVAEGIIGSQEEFNPGVILQLCRWFGYRKWSADIMIKLSKSYFNAYQEVFVLEKNMANFSIIEDFRKFYSQFNFEYLKKEIE